MKTKRTIQQELERKKALNPHFNRVKRSERADPETVTYVSRDPCFWCGTKRDVGCKHYPLEAK